MVSTEAAPFDRPLSQPVWEGIGGRTMFPPVEGRDRRRAARPGGVRLKLDENFGRREPPCCRSDSTELSGVIQKPIRLVSYLCPI